MGPDYRQEVLNVILAQLLQERGLVSVPESIVRAILAKRRRMPDVMVDFFGMRMIIEGEVSDQPGAKEQALASARQRVEEGIAHVGVAIVYPAFLRKVDFGQLNSQIATCHMETAVVSESGESGYTIGDINHLVIILKQTFYQLVQENVVGDAVAILDASIESLAQVIRHSPGFIPKAGSILDIQPLPPKKKKPTSDDQLEQVNAICRVGGLILVNAMIFQEVLAYHNDLVHPLHKILDQRNLLSSFSEHWKEILSINYFPIFYLARELILSLSAQADIINELKNLAKAAQRIVSMRAALRHDLMGRVYHRLLADAKYLGTYYTSIPAAILLLKLALRYDDTTIQWQDLNQISRLRIADLACGTGTLLMATADALTDNYLRAAAEASLPPDSAALHRLLVEQIIYGYDVLPSAIHMTASTLALRAPQITFANMSLYSLPLGGKEASLGSLEFLKSTDLKTRDLFGARIETRQVTGGGEIRLTEVLIPDLDLCVMNPPFTRSVIGNLLFGSFPDEEREKMQSSLKEVVRTRDLQASITAGLGAVFIALADRHLKPGGCLALVIPKALLSGVSWEQTRELLGSKYRVEYLVASHDPERWNFSESTNLSEVLLVARKFNNTGSGASPVVCLNLWRNPTTAFDALAVFQALKNNPVPPEFPRGQGAMELFLEKEKLGEALAFDWEAIKEWPIWMLPCAFAQSDLIRTTYYLAKGRLWLPGFGLQGQVPLCPLKNFASLGPDGRDIHDGFRLSPAPTAYAAFWGHDTKSVFTINQKPNAYLSPLTQASAGRPLRRVEDLWPLAGKLLLGDRIRLNTSRLWAVRLPFPALSNVWWPVSFKDRFDTDVHGKTFALWCNSTLALLLLLANRQETEGAWVQFKKPILAGLPVLDLSSLSKEQLEALAAVYDEVSDTALLTFPEMHVDPVRARIDAAIGEVLGLPDFSVLRRLLAQEPVVCLKRL
jgi:hypothetical protein